MTFSVLQRLCCGALALLLAACGFATAQAHQGDRAVPALHKSAPDPVSVEGPSHAEEPPPSPGELPGSSTSTADEAAPNDDETGKVETSAPIADEEQATGATTSTLNLLDGVAIGLVAGLNYNMFSANLQNALPNSGLNVLDGGRGFSGLFGLTIDLLPLEENGAQFRFAYDVKAYSHSVQWTHECLSAENEVIPFETDSEHRFSLANLAMSLLLRFRLAGEVSLMIGPTIQNSLGKTNGEIEHRVLEPHACVLLPTTVDGSNNTALIETEPDQDFRWGLDMALVVRREIDTDWILSAELGGQYFITYLHRNADELPDNSRPRTDGVVTASISDQILHSLQARIGLLYAF